jgi:hypothetical protein
LFYRAIFPKSGITLSDCALALYCRLICVRLLSQCNITHLRARIEVHLLGAADYGIQETYVYSLHHHRDRHTGDRGQKLLTPENRMGLLLTGVAILATAVYSAFFFAA